MKKCIHVEVKDKYKLVIYECNYGLRGELFVQVKPFKYEKMSVAKFYYKDKDASIYRVKEYFGF